jgi:hypothetical protein
MIAGALAALRLHFRNIRAFRIVPIMFVASLFSGGALI